MTTIKEDLTIQGVSIKEYEEPQREMLEDIIDIFADVAFQFEHREDAHKENYLQILRDKSRIFKGDDLEQKPESFTQQFLVYPLLKLLGFEYIIEPKMKFDTIGERESGSFADFRITNASYIRKDEVIGAPWGHEEFVNKYEPNIIGETKPLNHYDAAKKEIQERYVGPHMEIDVGIATDGLDWGVYIDIPRAKTWDEFSLRQFAMKITNYVYESPILQDTYSDADDQLLSFLRFFHKPNFEYYLFQRDAGVMWK